MTDAAEGRSDRRARLGRLGEEEALARYLTSGYTLVARTWRCRLGEIDLVLARGSTLVFCEVKARRGSGFGSPHEAVGDRKQRKLRALGEAFMLVSGSRRRFTGVRFDVASVTVDGRGRASVYVFESAF